MTDAAALPYRLCAGITLFNKEGLVWVGRRLDGPNEAEGRGQWWQMPQGGIDEGEQVEDAARREMMEETNVRSARFLGQTDWLSYDLPQDLMGKAWRGKYRGQRMKWTAFRFEGDESEINVDDPGPGHKPEFTAWRWEQLERLPGLIVPFKQKIYQKVASEFARFVPR